MIKSMTGFASVSREHELATIGVTVRSVNHRYLDVQLRAPQLLAAQETTLRGLVQQRLTRGRVEVTITRTSYPNDVVEALVLPPTSVSSVAFPPLTEGPVSVSAVVPADTAVSVDREDLRGFGGHNSGTVIRDSNQVVQVMIGQGRQHRHQHAVGLGSAGIG